MQKQKPPEILKGFSKLCFKERINLLKKLHFVNPNDIDKLAEAPILSFELAELLIENVISLYTLPLGVAVNFVIDGQDYIIPMVVEETSVIAASSKTAGYIKKHGFLTTSIQEWVGTGQIQIPRIHDLPKLQCFLSENQDALLEDINTNLLASMIKRGGGALEIFLRTIKRPDGYIMGVIHLHIDTQDAMGANKINQCCEYLAKKIISSVSENTNLKIITNLSKRKLVKATVDIHMPLEQARAIEEASLFAHLDPFRATTNNKGVMNGIDAVLLATGNDWRAVEAGIHAYACRSGNYQSITSWSVCDNRLVGHLEAPIDVGITGGVTKLHPLAQLSLQILNVKKATELARIIAAVGLVQNLGALIALTSCGITQGHMKLHISNLILQCGIEQDYKHIVKSELEKMLKENGHISQKDVIEVYEKLKGLKEQY